VLSPALLILSAVAAAIWIHRRRAHARGSRDPRRDLAVVAMQMGRGLRAGLTTLEVLEDSTATLRGPVAEQLTEVCASMRRGASLSDALAGWRTGVRDGGASARQDGPQVQDVELFAVAAGFGHRHGRGEPQAFESVGAALMDRTELADEVHALTAQARASVLVLCALPVLGCLTLAMINPSMATVMLTHPLARLALVAAVSLDALALWVGHKLTKRVLG
jgi:Flp pilus assembly protein TadB